MEQKLLGLLAVRAELYKHNIEFTETKFFSGFWGTRIEFPTTKVARKAEKLLGMECRGYYGKWAFDFY